MLGETVDAPRVPVTITVIDLLLERGLLAKAVAQSSDSTPNI